MLGWFHWKTYNDLCVECDRAKHSYIYIFKTQKYGAKESNFLFSPKPIQIQFSADKKDWFNFKVCVQYTKKESIRCVIPFFSHGSFIVDSIGIERHITVLCRWYEFCILYSIHIYVDSRVYRLWNYSANNALQNEILQHKRTEHVYQRDNAHKQHFLEYWLYVQHLDVAYYGNGENLVVAKTPHYVGIYFVILSFVVLFTTANISGILNCAYCMAE